MLGYSTKIFYNAKVYSMDKYNSVYDAIVIQGDKIIAVGTNEEVLPLKNDETELFNLKGKAMIPGINDTHTHLFWAALSELKGELFVPKSIKELLEYIEHKVKELPEGHWIHLKNTYPTRLKEHRYPTLEELDNVAPKNPVFIDGAYAGQVNSLALKIAGIDKYSDDPAAGKFIRDTASGELTGLLFGCNNIFNQYQKKDEFSLADYIRAISYLQEKYNSLGITSVIDAFSDNMGVEAVNELFRVGNLTLRIAFTKVISGKETKQDLQKFKTSVNPPREWASPAFCKTLIDGGILTGTSYMREAYCHDPNVFGINFPGFHGIINCDKEKLISNIELAQQCDLQVAAHCIGDAAVDLMLDAYDARNAHSDITNMRHCLIHADFTDNEALRRIKELNLSLLFQPAWHYKDAAILDKTLSKNTMECFLPYSSYVQKAIRAAAGSDHMIKFDSVKSQNPYNPFIGLYNMVTRKTEDGKVIGSDKSISREQALKMYTINAAHITFQEKLKGSLEVGKLADFAVLSKDFFHCEEDEIPDINSVLTVVGGKIVYDIL